jgi:hypothetical protein
MRPPTPTSANGLGLREAISHHFDSSDEEDEQVEDELVSDFDQSSIQRCVISSCISCSSKIKLTEALTYNMHVYDTPVYTGRERERLKNPSSFHRS